MFYWIMKHIVVGPILLAIFRPWVVGLENVPRDGAVVLASNHLSFIDSIFLPLVVDRPVVFLAKSEYFTGRGLKGWATRVFFQAAGQLPIDRSGGKASEASLETGLRVLREGGILGIYPEGTTHSESRVQRIKTGAARIALEYEAGGRGRPLALVPVGLNFEARKSFGGHVRVSFGEPIPLPAYAAAYRRDPVRAVEALTTAIQQGMEAEVLHVARPEREELIRAVAQIYAGDLIRELQRERGLATRQIDPLRLSRTIADAVAHFERREPARVEQLWAAVLRYRAMLAAYQVRDQAVRAHAGATRGRARLRRSWEASLGLPVFAYGLLVNGLPYLLPRWLAHRTARKETDYATTRLLASVVAFPLFWALEVWIVWRLTSAGWTLLFALSLPVSGLLAYRYLRGVGRLRDQFRFGWLALTHRHSAARLLAERQVLVSALERAKEDYLVATRGSSF